MTQKNLDPLAPDGPAPTETVQDWHAILNSARKFTRSEPWKSEIEKVEFIESYVGDTGKTRALHVVLRFPDDMSGGLMGFIYAAARPVFGRIYIGWGSP